MKLALAALTLVVVSGCSGCTTPDKKDAPAAAKEISWRSWSNEVFAEAKAKNKLVLLDLGTGWCHWCHVMDETTYKDPAVVAVVDEHYVAVRVDADARLDLASRYSNYGWPATIVFDSKGTELAKRRGFIKPGEMAALLRAFADDPTPGPSALADAPGAIAAATSSTLGDALAKELLGRFEFGWDQERAGWGRIHKFVELDAIELSMRLPGPWEERARRTLDAERKFLIDPVWGGAYQYSDSGVWQSPHFEKIMSRQAADMAAFALGYARWRDPAHLAAARDVERYLVDFLSSPDGTFYASQDADLVKGEHGGDYFKADDAGRRKLGMPAIDRHVYARENGQAIEALAVLYAASGDEKTLARAVKAAEKILATHSIEDGGFVHDAADRSAACPLVYLGDTLAMGQALLRLHQVTGEKRWLDRSVAAARFAKKSFPAEAGFGTSRPCKEDVAAPRPELDENTALARWMNALHRTTGDASFREQAERAMKLVAAPESHARRGHYVAGTLLADLELREEPLHVNVIGEGKEAQALARACFAVPARAVVVERDIKKEPAAALLCGKGQCRPPVTDEAELHKVAAELLRD